MIYAILQSWCDVLGVSTLVDARFGDIQGALFLWEMFSLEDVVF